MTGSRTPFIRSGRPWETSIFEATRTRIASESSTSPPTVKAWMRATRLTAGPTTPYLTRSVLPMLPATTDPTCRPIPMLSSGRPRCRLSALNSLQGLLHREGAAHRALGVVGPAEGRAEEDEDPVADELVDRAAVLDDHRRHLRQVLVEQPDHRRRPEALRELGEAAQIGHEHRDLADLAAELQRIAVAQALLGELRADVAPEGLADEIAIAQGLHHVAHGPRQHADLVAAPGNDGQVQIAVANAACVPRQLVQRTLDPARQGDAAGHREEQRHHSERERDLGLCVDVLRVVGRGHDDLDDPLQVADGDGH